MTVVMGALALSFAIWGIGDVFRGFGSSTVAKVGSTEISVEQFRQAYTDRLQQLGRQLGRPVTPDQARAFGLDRQLAGQLVAEAAVDEYARRLGLHLSDAEIARQIMADPNFRGLNGQFDRARFDAIIRNAGYTEARFTAEQRRVTLRREIAESVNGGVAATKIAIEAVNRFQNEQRTVEYVVLDKARAGEIAAPAADVLAKYFDDRKTLFRAPEYRKVAVLALTPAAIAASVAVGDEDVKRAYEDQRARFVTPEKRKLQQMVFPDADDARVAADKIASGTPFDVVAVERGLKDADIDLGTVTKAGMVDKTVAEAAFALKEGETSAPITGRFGTVLVTVQAIEPETVRPFDQVAAELKQQVALERAKADLANRHDKIEDERAGGASLAEIGPKFGLAVTTVEAIDRSGRAPDGTPVAGLPAGVDVVANAFQTDVGVDTEALQVPGGGYVWYDVVGVTPSRERPLDEVKDKVTERWHDEQVAERLKAKATEIADKLKGGATLADVAKADGLEVRTAAGLRRGRPTEALPAKVIELVFRLAKGAAGAEEGRTATERVVVRVTDVVVPAFDAAAPDAKKFAEALTKSLSDDLLGQYITRVQTDLGATINAQALARVVGGGTDQN